MRICLLTLSVLTMALLSTNALARNLFIATLYAPPIAYVADGETRGYGVEIVEEALQRSGFSAKVTIVPWKRGLLMTRNGEQDGLFYTVRNDEREKWFFFPDEFLIMETTVMVKRAGEVLNISPDNHDYPELSLGIGRGYFYGPKLKNFLNQSVFLKVEEANTLDLNFKKLLQGRIDMFLADSISAEHFLQANNNHELAEIVTDAAGRPVPFDSVKSYLAFSRKTMTHNEVRRFSDALSRMKDDGTYDRIINRYRRTAKTTNHQSE